MNGRIINSGKQSPSCAVYQVLVLGTQDNVITLLYAPVIPVEKVSLTINHKVVLEDGSEKLFETTTLQD